MGDLQVYLYPWEKDILLGHDASLEWRDNLVRGRPET